MKAGLYLGLMIFFGTFCLGEDRIWMDKTGRAIRAEFISATKYKVKIRRKSDQRVFTVPLTSLSDEDQAFVAAQVAQNQTDQDARNAQVQKEPQRIPLGVGVDPVRSMIPSLGENELGKGYSSVYSTLVNTLVWWGETIAPGMMPHNRRDSSIERISEEVERYFNHKSNFYYSFPTDAGDYSAKKLKGFVIVSHGRTYAPTLEELSKFTSGWYGIIAEYRSYRTNSSAYLRGGSTTYLTLVDVQGRSIHQNLMGNQYSFLMADELIGPERFRGSERIRLNNLKKKGYLQVANPSLVPGDLFRNYEVVVLESVLVFELFKLPEAEE